MVKILKTLISDIKRKLSAENSSTGKDLHTWSDTTSGFPMLKEQRVKANPKTVLSGIYYIDGDVASGYGALAAVCDFVAGYPITPSTEAFEVF